MGTTKLTARATHSEDPAGVRAGRILAGPSRNTAGKSDDALVKLAKLGDESAIATLYERYSPAILRYCCSILRSQQEAEDIQQEVFLHAISALRHGPGPISFRPWLYRVAHNACISHLRSRKPTVVAEDSSLSGVSTEPETVQREELRQLLADISRLSPVQRGALLLREMDGFSYEQIAAALDLPLTTVRSTIFRARATLQGMAEARDADCETIQAELSEMADRRGRRSRRITSHLRVCNQCREFREGLRYRPSVLGDYSPSRLNGLRNAKVAAVVAGLVALLGGGLQALGAFGSAGGRTPTTAQRHQTVPVAPTAPPRVVPVPAAPKAPRGAAGGASRGSATPGLRLRLPMRGAGAPAAAAPHARADKKATARGGHGPTATVRRNIARGRRPNTILPQAGGDVGAGGPSVPYGADPQTGSGSGSGLDAASGSGESSTGTSGPAPENVAPSSGDAGGSAGGTSGGGHDDDPGSLDRPQVTHNDSTASDPADPDAPSTGSAASSGDLPQADEPQTGPPSSPPPPPLVTSDSDASAP